MAGGEHPDRFGPFMLQRAAPLVVLTRNGRDQMTGLLLNDSRLDLRRRRAAGIDQHSQEDRRDDNEHPARTSLIDVF